MLLCGGVLVVLLPQGVDGVAADAQAQGLMHLGSYYVNLSCSTDPPGLTMNGSDAQANSSNTHSSGDSLQKQAQQPSSSSGGSNGHAHTSVSYRPAPRTPYMASRLYNLSGSQVRLLCMGRDLGTPGHRPRNVQG
jgi:hypothetical protein